MKTISTWQVIKDTNRVCLKKHFCFCKQISHRRARNVIMGVPVFVPPICQWVALQGQRVCEADDDSWSSGTHQYSSGWWVGGGRWVMGSDHHRSILLSTLARVNFRKIGLVFGFLLEIFALDTWCHVFQCWTWPEFNWWLWKILSEQDSEIEDDWSKGTDSMILLLFLVNEICWDFLPLWKILEALDHPWFKIARSATVTRPLLGLGWCWHWDHFGVVMIKIQSDWMSSLMSFFSLYLCCRENAIGHTTYDMFLTIFNISINSLWYVCGKKLYTLQNLGQLWHQQFRYDYIFWTQTNMNNNKKIPTVIAVDPRSP